MCKRIQKITSDFKIKNLTIEGKRIQNFAKKNSKLLENIYRINFENGGCYLFARILKEKLKQYPTEYISIGRENIQENGIVTSEVLDHIVLKIKLPKLKEIYIDSDGVATLEDLKDKIIYCDGITKPFVRTNLSEKEIEKKINSFKNSKIEKELKKELSKLNIFNKKKKQKTSFPS